MVLSGALRLCYRVKTPASGNDNQLFASELYNMKLQARLTVLSACNSGSGEVWLGEGTMSLARAFAFAGCTSLVTSLWSISDQATSQMMANFYQSLKQGKEKHESLREAKLKYLESSSAEYAKPIYWAGFVMVGDTEALPTGFFKPDYLLYFIGAFLLALALFAVIKYVKRR
ncbi:MAG: CHAT domain-containing protein [Saprospiraceae bacterium]|nr:CHAT domain-containing protein [Saprospiraceae bacterium]